MLFYKISVKYSNNTRMVVHNSFSHVKDLLNKYTKGKAVKHIKVSVTGNQLGAIVNQSKMITCNSSVIKQHTYDDWPKDMDTIDSGYMFY